MTTAAVLAQMGSNNTTFRNRIYNGAMMIDQRNAGGSVSTGGANVFPVDRFFMQCQSTGSFSGQRSTTAPAGFINSLLLTVTSSVASPASGDYRALAQRIEGFNVADLGWGAANAQPVTLSFWVRSSVTGTFSAALNNGNDRGYPFTYTINSANTFEYKTVTIPGDTSGTWNTGNGTGLMVVWDMGTGSNFSGTANTWQAGNIYRTSGTVNLISTNGATFYITGVQLEAGTNATPFEFRPYGTELALCQRYFEKSFDIGTAPSNGASATTLSTNNGAAVGIAQNIIQAGPTVLFKVTKRTAPTMTKYGNNSGDWLYAAQNATSWSGGASNSLSKIGEGSFVADQQVANQVAIFVMGHWTASAEL